jgi:hypothetical protein
MIKTAARLLLLRVLPGRLIPLVTVAEAVMLLRSVRRRRRGTVAVNTPPRSRTAPPPPAPGIVPASADASAEAAVDPGRVRDERPVGGPTAPRRSGLARFIRPRSGVGASTKRLPHI